MSNIHAPRTSKRTAHNWLRQNVDFGYRYEFQHFVLQLMSRWREGFIRTQRASAWQARRRGRAARRRWPARA
eukprot:5226917-Pleurochrysis_carterae.AAC.1